MPLSHNDEIALHCAATRMRINSIKATSASNSGHPTTCSSIADIMAVLFLKEMHYKPKDPGHPSNDRFVLSKGHAAPVLYAAWAEVGYFTEKDLLTLRKIDSDLEGHPTTILPFVDVATGSLGQGLSNAAGMAYVGKYIDKANYRVYCICGDGEVAEGSVAEAMNFASHYKLNNLVMILDVNRLGQSQATCLGHNMDVYKARAVAYGWHAIVIDGHNIREIVHALEKARELKDQPVMLLCKTFKGHNFPGIANEDNWHGKPLGNKTDEVIAHLQKELTNNAQNCEIKMGTLTPPAPTDDCAPMKLLGSIRLPYPPKYTLNEEVATRLAYGDALAKLGKSCDRVIGLDGDTKNSTFAIKLLHENPKQFIECFIAEQNMVGVGIGAGCRQRTIPFVSAFAAFLSRAYDQIRMGALSMTNCNFVGSHAGVSIGEDGASQMALEDLSMFRTVLGSTVFYPSDAVSCERAVELAANKAGICYIRTGRPNAKVIYSPEEKFEIGKGKVVKTAGTTNDAITVVGSGVTLYEALAAAEELAGQNIHVRVIDPFTIKPMDSGLLKQAVAETRDTVITVEDHQREGGLGDAVSQALSDVGVKHVIKSLCVREVPHSGKPNELMDKYCISAKHIVKAVKEVLGK